MFLRCRTRIKRPQVSALPGLRILFPGVEPILSRLQFSNHDANAFFIGWFPAAVGELRGYPAAAARRTFAG